MDTISPLFAKRKPLAYAVATASLSASQVFAVCPGTHSSATTLGCTLTTVEPSVTITTTGSIAVTGATAIFVTALATGTTINNSGTVSTDTDEAIYDAGFLDGTLTNNAGASISGQTGIIISGDISSGSVLTNNGSITASRNGVSNTNNYGISLQGVSTGATVVNNGSITVTGTYSGVNTNVYGLNASGFDGDLSFGANSTVTVNATGATTVDAWGIFITDVDNSTATLDLDGDIDVTGTATNANGTTNVYGIEIGSNIDGALSIGTGATISVTANGGSTSAGSGAAYGLWISRNDQSSGSVTNSGTVTSIASGANAQAYGIYFSEYVFDNALVDNQGTMNVTATAGVGTAEAAGMYFNSDIYSSGVVVNNGTINVTATGPRADVHGLYLDEALYSDATLENAGTLNLTATGVNRARVLGISTNYLLNSNASILNSGDMNLDVTVTGTATCVGNCSAVGMLTTFSIGNGVTLANTGTIAIDSAAPGGIDIGASGISVSDIDAGGIVRNAGTITVDVTGAGTVAALGLDVQGTLDSTATLENTGTVTVTANTTGAFDIAAAVGVGINFMAAGSSFTNSGTINASASGGINSAYGIVVAGGAGGSVINDGIVWGGVRVVSASTVVQNNNEIIGGSILTGDYVQGSNGIYRAQLQDAATLDGAIITGDFDISANDTVGISIDPNTVDLPYGSDGSYSFSNVVSYGTITKTGTSLLADSDNPVWDLTAVDDGVGNISYTINLASTVTVAAGSTISNAGTIALRIPDTGGAAPLNLNVQGTVDGQILLGDGVLNLDGGAASITGDVVGDSGSAVNVNDDFTAASNFSGLTTFTVAAGANLSVSNYSIEAASFNGLGTVNLGGGAVVGNYTNSGTLSVAAGSVGTITGNYTQASSGTLSFEVASDSSYGRLVVSDTADFSAGGTLALDVTGTLSDGAVLTDLVSSGTLLGFENVTVTDNNLLLDFTLEAQGNSIGGQGVTVGEPVIVVELVANPEDIVAASQYSVATGAATALGVIDATGEATDELATFLDILRNEPEEDSYSEAIAKTLPVLTGVGTNAQLETVSNTSAAVGTRLADVRGASAGDSLLTDGQVWVKVMGGKTEMDNRNGVDGFDADSYGLLVGVDGMLTEDWLVGGGFVFSDTDIEGKSTFGHTLETDSYQLIVYGQRRFGEDRSFYANTSLAVGMATTDIERTIDVSGTGGALALKATADYEGVFARMTGATGAVFLAGERTTISPELNMAYTYIDEDGYTEAGAGNLGLDVFSRDEETLIAGFRTRIAYGLNDDFSAGLISVHFGVGRDLVGGDGIVSSRYIGSRNIAGGPIFNTPAKELSRTVWYGGTGYEVRIGESFNVMIGYEYEGRDELDTEWLAGELRWSF